MAIYHLHIDSYRRSRGRTAIGGMAYRRGVKAGCHHSGRHYNFRGKGEVVLSGFVNAEGDETDFTHLDNLILLYQSIEQNETHCRATVGREIEVALPVELPLSQQQALILSFIGEVRQVFGAERSFFDYSIHAKDGNPHAHICMSEREQIAPFTFSNTKRRDWDGQEFIKQCRQIWEHHTNLVLEYNGISQRVDSRSHAERGLATLPSLHTGRATYFDSEVKAMNDQIKQVNQNIQKRREAKKVAETIKPLSQLFPKIEPVPELTAPALPAEDEAWGIVCEDAPTDPAIRRLLREKYRHAFGFSKYIARIEFQGDYAVLHFKDRSRVVDYGHRVVAEQSSPELAAHRLIELAMAKQWQTVSFTGDDAFLRCAFVLALDKGLEIQAKNEAQERLLAEIRQGREGVASAINATHEKIFVPLASTLGERILKLRAGQAKSNPTTHEKPRARRGRKSGGGGCRPSGALIFGGD